MFLDASAIVAIVAQESDAAALTARLARAAEIHTSPIAVCEATLGLVRIGKVSLAASRALVDRLLAEFAAEIIPITPEIGEAALAAFDRFGKGRHAAALNMGDCFAYACAEHLGTALLCKGSDFACTDLA